MLLDAQAKRGAAKGNIVQTAAAAAAAGLDGKGKPDVKSDMLDSALFFNRENIVSHTGSRFPHSRCLVAHLLRLVLLSQSASALLR